MKSAKRALIGAAVAGLACSYTPKGATPRPPIPSVEQPSSSGLLAGRVVDADADTGLVGALVEVVGTNRGNITRCNGYYIVADVPPGLVDVRAVTVDFGPAWVDDVRIEPGDTVVLDFELTRADDRYGSELPSPWRGPDCPLKPVKR